MHWNDVVEKVLPHVVKIETPEGHGTGFICLYNRDQTVVGVATALHVVSHADKWGLPIRILQEGGKEVMLPAQGPPGGRLVLEDRDTDSAVIIMTKAEVDLVWPESCLPLRPLTEQLPIGVEIGWLGYPGMGSAADTLCFFAGTVSAFQARRRAYLVDGVAINGCSGGPVVYSTAADGVQIVGIVSAYIANRATGDTLPGLAVAQDVSHFDSVVRYVKSVDEARHQERAKEKPAHEEG